MAKILRKTVLENDDGSHFKFYWIELNEHEPLPGRLNAPVFSVDTKWGRMDGNFPQGDYDRYRGGQTQQKCRGYSKEESERVYLSLKNAKENKGYKVVEDKDEKDLAGIAQKATGKHKKILARKAKLEKQKIEAHSEVKELLNQM